MPFLAAIAAKFGLSTGMLLGITGIVSVVAAGGAYFAWNRHTINEVFIDKGRLEQVQKEQTVIEKWREQVDKLEGKGLTDKDVDQIFKRRAN